MNRKARRLLKSTRKRKSDRLGGGAFETIDVLMGEAVALNREGRLDEALCRYREILELYPDHPDALNNVSLIVGQTGDSDQALKFIRAAVKATPDKAEAHNNLGYALDIAGSLEEAESSFRRAIDIAPNLVEAHINLANLLMKVGRPAEAVESLRCALSLSPDNKAAHNGIGNALKSLGRHDAAMKHLRKAIEIDPGFAEALNNMAILLHEQGHLCEAIEAFRKAVAIKPALANSHYNLGCALTELGESEAAIDSFRDCLQFAPNHANACLNMSNLLLDEGRLHEAVPTFKQAATQFPSEPTVLAILANLLSDGDDLGDALESALRACHVDPNSSVAKCSVAKTLIEQGRHTEAASFYEDLPPAANEHDVVAHIWLYSSLLRQGHLQEARSVLGCLLEDAPLVPKQRQDLLVKKAIDAWLSGDLIGCRAAVTDAATVSEKAGILSVNNHALAFERFIRLLLEYREHHPELYADDTCEELHVIGESHCLSPHGTIAVVEGVSYRFVGHMILGCKAWHLADPRANYFQRAFKAIVRGLPDNANVLVTIGEIDCRPNEGIYPLHKKRRIDAAELIDNTVTGFVDFVTESAAGKNLQMNFCGVPAPHRDRFSRLPLPESEVFDYLDVVAGFSRKLDRTSTDRGCGFLDLYKMTVGDDGTSDGRFHIDDTHLLPQAFHHCITEQSPIPDQASAYSQKIEPGQTDSPLAVS